MQVIAKQHVAANMLRTLEQFIDIFFRICRKVMKKTEKESYIVLLQIHTKENENFSPAAAVCTRT